jgi:hypothetical protein
VAQPADADDDDDIAGVQLVGGLLGRVVGGDARVGVGSDLRRIVLVGQRDDRPLVGEEAVGEAAAWVSPGKATFSQCTSSPSRQGRQTPQVRTGRQMAGCPSSTVSTPSPTSTTVPAFSWPSVSGGSWGT